MSRLRLALLIGAGVLFVALAGAGAVFYFRIYKPVGGPLMVMSSARRLEEQRLHNHNEFRPPESGALTAAQVAAFRTVEETVWNQLAANSGVLARNQIELERAFDAHTLSVRMTLRTFGELRPFFGNAKVAQIDAMNRLELSAGEFDWIRRSLYEAAGLSLNTLDVSEIVGGVDGAVVRVRRSSPSSRSLEGNARLASPLGPSLQRWAPLGFFGL